MPEFSLKVASLVIKQFDDGYRLLAHSFEHDPVLPLRFPGGGVDPAESLECAIHRELLEEAGLSGLQVIRKLGEVRFYKQYSAKFVERHDFLLIAPAHVPSNWQFEVRGAGDDAGEIFNYRWIRPDEFYLVDIELQKFLDPLRIPELFPSEVSKASG